MAGLEQGQGWGSLGAGNSAWKGTGVGGWCVQGPVVSGGAAVTLRAAAVTSDCLPR